MKRSARLGRGKPSGRNLDLRRVRTRDVGLWSGLVRGEVRRGGGEDGRWGVGGFD